MSHPITHTQYTGTHRFSSTIPLYLNTQKRRYALARSSIHTVLRDVIISAANKMLQFVSRVKHKQHAIELNFPSFRSWCRTLFFQFIVDIEYIISPRDVNNPLKVPMSNKRELYIISPAAHSIRSQILIPTFYIYTELFCFVIRSVELSNEQQCTKTNSI